MLRIPLAAAGVLVLGTSTFAQTTSSQILPFMGQKDAGTYHLATGTWTRGTSSVHAWDDVIYDNTCNTGFRGSFNVARRMVDAGRIPSTTSPTNPGPPISQISWTGTMDVYTVNYFQLGYCALDPLPTLEINFWECFANCSDSTQQTPTVTFVLNNMPGAIGSAGGCWTVGIDLANSGLAFAMNADCDGMWNGGGGSDTFGWSWQQTSPSLNGAPGPFVSGDPLGYLSGGPGSSGCDYGANTAFYGGSSPTTQGTGLGISDSWEIDQMTPTPSIQGCFWFGGYFNGNLFSSWHMRIGAETGGPTPEPGFQYCPGDGVAVPCPCVNSNDGSMGGCDWGSATFLSGGVLTASGDNDYANADVTLIASAIENNFGIFFGANNQVNGGAGNPLNDGLRCAGGGLIRLTPPTMASGNTASHGPIETSDITAAPGVTRRYQYWFRTPGGPCGQMANLTNGYEIAWM